METKPPSTALNPLLDRLAARVARWPWWIIIIVVLLILVFYSILTSNIFRRALVFLTDSPQVSTDRFTDVIYNVRGADGQVKPVEGILTGQTAETISILTQVEVIEIFLSSDIAKITCETPGADGSCPVGQQVTVTRGSISGVLVFETLGRYQIDTAYGPVVDVPKINVEAAGTVRTPEGCSANPDGTCQIALKLKPDESSNTIQGLLTERLPDQITVQIAPPVTTTIKVADVVQVVRSTPAQCALNNLPGCDEGIFLTLGVTFLAFALSVLVGLFFGLMRVSSNLILFNISTVYVEIVRGVPLLVILLFVNYAFAPWFRDELPQLAPSLSRMILVVGVLAFLYQAFRRVVLSRGSPRTLIQPVIYIIIGVAIGLVLTESLRNNGNLPPNQRAGIFPPVQRAIIGLAVCYGAYLAELFRAGIQSVGRGQMEASRSLGMSYVQAMRYIILPQAFRFVLPPLGNEFIAILKDTSLIAILALPELTQRARLFATDTFRVFETYITVGFLYLCMTLFLSFLVRVVERRTALPR